jgi:hypothetical protein
MSNLSNTSDPRTRRKRGHSLRRKARWRSSNRAHTCSDWGSIRAGCCWNIEDLSNCPDRVENSIRRRDVEVLQEVHKGVHFSEGLTQGLPVVCLRIFHAWQRDNICWAVDWPSTLGYPNRFLLRYGEHAVDGIPETTICV